MTLTDLMAQLSRAYCLLRLFRTRALLRWVQAEAIMAETRSPRIAHLSWGTVDVEVNGGLRHFTVSMTS